MNYHYFTHMKKGVQLSLILAILLLNFTVSGTHPVHAAPPSNDDFLGATEIDQITYFDTVDLTEATQDTTDPDSITCTVGDTGTHDLEKGNNSVWYKYTPSVKELIALNTFGSEYIPEVELDTYIAVWTGTEGSLNLVKCNDDTDLTRTSEVIFKASANVTYYIEIAIFNCLDGVTSCGEQNDGNLIFNAKISNTHVTIADKLKGSYYVPAGDSERVNFTKLNKGPALVEGSLDAPLVAAMGVNYKQSGKFVSYSQTMGFPADQVTTEYVFPRYTNNSSQGSQLRIANVSDIDTTVEVRIAGDLKGSPISLLAGQAKTVVFSGVDAGPVRVTSTTAANIVTSMRVIYKNGGKNVSYSELMGYPADQLTTEYWFPYYINSTNLKSQLRVANMGNAETTVEVYVNGVLKKSIDILAGKSVTVPVNGKGTMRVVSTNGAVNILPSLRQIYFQNSSAVSFSELMGLPNEDVTKSYAFPWYTNNTSTSTKIRVVNLGTENADVEIYIAGTLKDTISLVAGEGKIISLAGSDNGSGPVRLDSTNPNVNILVSLQITFKQNGTPVSYSEITGYPYQIGSPTTSFLFPWYTTNSTTKSYLLFGYP